MTQDGVHASNVRSREFSNITYAGGVTTGFKSRAFLIQNVIHSQSTQSLPTGSGKVKARLSIASMTSPYPLGLRKLKPG